MQTLEMKNAWAEALAEVDYLEAVLDGNEIRMSVEKKKTWEVKDKLLKAPNEPEELTFYSLNPIYF